MIEKKDNLEYLQYMGINLNKNNLHKIYILIEKLKNFLFLKGFYLKVEDEFIFSKKYLLDIINNLSKLNFI